jgi:RadC-like JAB domain
MDTTQCSQAIVFRKYISLSMPKCNPYNPSGVAEPSRADQEITQVLVEALRLMDIRVLDHLVVGHDEPVSMADLGML